MKKLVTTLTTLALILATPIQTLAITTFPDINNTDANTKLAINTLTEYEIIGGYPDGTYKPNNLINRAEFLKILISTTHIPVSMSYELDCLNSSFDQFPDVPQDAWFTPYVCGGYYNKIVQGYPDGKFHPEDNINYAEALKIIYKAHIREEDLLSSGYDKNIWYDQYLQGAKQNNIDLGISPDKKITRGEMAKLIYNFMEKKKVGTIALEGELNAEPTSGPAPLTVNFRVNLSEPVYESPYTNFHFYFGDGEKSEYNQVSLTEHTYTEPGEYEATVKVTNGLGKEIIKTKTITVE